jgi:CubicO group peptidase (beta-lactamase class C family)
LNAAVDVHGTVDDGYEPVRAAFAANFAERGDTGAALCVHREGRVIVDLWAGEAAPGRPWRRETAAVVRSVSKGPASTVLHLLHQRGQLDLDAPVSTYWPEFKANGKERLLVRHVLAHRAGLPALDVPLTPQQAVDGVSGPAALAAQAPLWEPGADHGYHPHTFGWLLAELVRRATGRTLGRWFAEELARPLGLTLHFGTDQGFKTEHSDAEGELARLTDVPTPSPPAATGLRQRPKKSVARAYEDPASLTRRAFDAVDPRPDENAPDWLAAGLPSSGAVATARSLSRFYAALIGPVDPAPGGYGRTGGGRLFTPATLTQARSMESGGPDRVLVVNSRFGLGYMLHGPGAPMLADGSFGHPGRGGSLAFADPESGTGFAYVTAAMQRSVMSDPRAHALVRALRGCG